jgi:hypothetical protein
MANSAIPHTSRKTSPEAPSQPRKPPQRQAQKGLLLPGIPA